MSILTRYWLLKSEPETFSFDDLLQSPGQTTAWEGVRNFEARNLMRDDMRIGDRVLFYHSSTPHPGIVGVAEVVSPPRADPTQFDPKGGLYDERASEEEPRWFLVDIKAVEKLPRVVSLREIKEEPSLAEMRLVARGNRLSVMRVEEREYSKILDLAKQQRPVKEKS